MTSETRYFGFMGDQAELLEFANENDLNVSRTEITLGINWPPAPRIWKVTGDERNIIALKLRFGDNMAPSEKLSMGTIEYAIGELTGILMDKTL